MEYIDYIRKFAKEAREKQVVARSLCVEAMRQGKHDEAIKRMEEHACYTYQLREFNRVINSHLYYAHIG